MTTQYPQGSWCGRCFTYPQGGVSFLPQILAAAALYGCFAAFSTWEALENNWINHAPNFLCILIKVRTTESGGRLLGGGEDYYYYYDSLTTTTLPPGDNDWIYSHECYSLTFHSQQYWDIDEDDTKWAWAIRLACLTAIVTTIAGGIATLVLWSATCFPLPPKTIRNIAIVFFVCVPMSCFTLIAAATDLCKKEYPTDVYANVECKRNGAGIRLSYGATTMLFAALFYALAGCATLGYRTAVLNETTNHHEDLTSIDTDDHKQERDPLIVQQQQQQQQQQPQPQPVTRTAIKHTLEGTITTKETTHPDGTVTMDVIRDEEML